MFSSKGNRTKIKQWDNAPFTMFFNGRPKGKNLTDSSVVMKHFLYCMLY
jgi:hypothetical protein